MKKRRIRFGMMICLTLGILWNPANRIEAQAEEVVATVQGSVMAGTTTELLHLATKEGNMEIKMDSGTDASDCKVILPGSHISVSVSHGSDGYLHAVKITSSTESDLVTLDASTSATVVGTISEKSTDNVLYVKTEQGDMEIKMDPATDMSGCSVLVANKSYRIVCERGSDAYIHAVSISDGGTQAGAEGNTAAASVTALTPAPESVVRVDTTTVTGTVGKKTRADLLYLTTTYGEMQIVIDGNTDTRNGMFLIPDRKMTVSVYRGEDAYMHAAVIVGSKESVTPASLDTSSPSSVTGTVTSESGENIMHLNTSAGDMELKLDTVQSITGCKVLLEDSRVTVTCARGEDAYMHAISITAK
ncbi:MAG: hypothetical protein NC311_19740 [Muribaculaceae bacterium]|nr:hypothetical protein [Muribaculaceae bacterium]